MATKEELGDKIEPKLKTLLNFKIGKTGQTIKERYDEEYSELYSNYEEIGGGEMKGSDRYIVYLVYNK